MTLVVEVDGVPLPDGALTIQGPNTNLPGGVQGLPLAAWYGEALEGGYVIDDPDGDFDFSGLHTIVAYETASSRPFISGGWIMGRRVRRGIYTSGPGRVHDVDFIDINWNFALIKFRAASAHRPAETDLVRAAYIRESAAMADTPSFDNGRFNVTDNPINFDDSDLVNRYPIEAFNEFVGIAGKNFYNYFDNDEEQISLHYDLVGVGPTATIAVSNDMADTDSTTFYPFLDAELDKGPAYKVTGILMNYRGAYAYGIRQATIDELGPTMFSPSGLQRDEGYQTDRIGRPETAAGQIASMLEQRAVDTDTIKFSIRVPAAQVNDAYPGELLPSKFVHLPGYETSAEIPIIRRNVVPTPGRTNMYDIHLEVSQHGLPSGPGGGVPGVFPHRPAQCSTPVPENVAQGVFSTLALPFGFTATEGRLLLLILASRNSAGSANRTPPAGYVQLAYQRTNNPVGFQDAVVVFGKMAVGGETSVTPDTGSPGSWPTSDGGDWFVEEWSGVTLDDVTSAKNVGSGTTMTGESVVSTTGGLVLGIFVQSQDNTKTFTPAAGWTMVQEQGSDGQHPDTIIVWDEASAATFMPEVTSNRTNGWRSITLLFACVPDGNCPAAGTPVEEETVVLSGPDGVTRCPFADGTLHVYIDDVEQTAKLVSQDGVTGEFTLGFTPTPTEVCTVSYLGR